MSRTFAFSDVQWLRIEPLLSSSDGRSARPFRGYRKVVEWNHKPRSPTRMRRQWLTGIIREVHTASRGTYGVRRVHAELTRGMDVPASERPVAGLLSLAGIAGFFLAGQGLTPAWHRHQLLSSGAVNSLRLSPNDVWVTDIIERPTRGKV